MKRGLVILAVLATAAGCNIDYSNGTRVGVVNKLSKKGIFCKTWEGEMSLGGYRVQGHEDGSSSAVANLWSFTVQADPLAFRLLKFMEAGRRVRITYQQVLFFAPCTTDTGYWAVAVDEAQ